MHCFQLTHTAADLLRRGDVDAAAIVSHRFPLERIEDAFEFAAGQRDKAVKVMVCQEDTYE